MNRGWKTLCALNGTTVEQEARPNGKCRYCGTELFWTDVQTKTGLRHVPMVEAGHGGGGLKALIRHRCSNQGVPV